MPWSPVCGRRRSHLPNYGSRPMLLKNASFGQRGIAANVQGERTGSRGIFFGLGDLVLRQFTLPCWSLLVLLRTTASPFVVSSARSPPEETRREHRSARAGAVDQVSGFA